MSQNNTTINCLIVDDESVARDIIASHLKAFENIKVIAKCANAMEAFKLINKQTVDLLFLDINMPEINGISLAKSIDKNIKIIFTTAYRDYAVDGFELRAVDYLLKPISFERLQNAVTSYFDLHVKKINKISSHQDLTDFMFIRSERKMLKVDFSEISYIESLGDYLKIHLKTNTLVTRETITNIEVKLPQNDFIRIHRSFIVALNKIESYTNEYVVVVGKALTISRSYKEKVLKYLEQF